MSYLNGKYILPPALLKKVQQYVQGASIYIPLTEPIPPRRHRRDSALLIRNAEILRRFLSGVPVRQLAKDHHLSPQAIYKIIAQSRK